MRTASLATATLRTRRVTVRRRLMDSATDKIGQIGTYNAAVLAARHNIPFIVVAPVSTVDLEVADGSG